MKNHITASGNIPTDLEILDEMLPCEDTRVHFKGIQYTNAGRKGYNLILDIEINEKSYQWTATTKNADFVDWNQTHEPSAIESKQAAIGEVLDSHYDDIMKAATEYIIFNRTDGITASGETFNTPAEAEEVIKKIRQRFKDGQGYYRNNRWEKMNPDDVIYEVVEIYPNNQLLIN